MRHATSLDDLWQWPRVGLLPQGMRAFELEPGFALPPMMWVSVPAEK